MSIFGKFSSILVGWGEGRKEEGGEGERSIPALLRSSRTTNKDRPRPAAAWRGP